MLGVPGWSSIGFFSHANNMTMKKNHICCFWHCVKWYPVLVLRILSTPNTSGIPGTQITPSIHINPSILGTLNIFGNFSIYRTPSTSAKSGPPIYLVTPGTLKTPINLKVLYSFNSIIIEKNLFYKRLLQIPTQLISTIFL